MNSTTIGPSPSKTNALNLSLVTVRIMSLDTRLRGVFWEPSSVSLIIGPPHQSSELDNCLLNATGVCPGGSPEGLLPSRWRVCVAAPIRNDHQQLLRIRPRLPSTDTRL